MIPAPTQEELGFLENIQTRREVLKGAPLIITGKLFGRGLRLASFELENTQFINCDFVECTMLGGVLRNVHFTNCLFVSNLWDEGQWDDVLFTRCAWRGRFNMGPKLGTTTLKFEECEFIGATAEQMGYGGPADYFGIVGGTSGAVYYSKCNFERTYINGGSSLNLHSCKLNESMLLAKDNSALLVEDVAAIGVIKVGSGVGDFSSVTVRKSSFPHALIFKNSRIGTGIFEDVSGNLNLSVVKARSIELRRVVFVSPDEPNPQYRYGLSMESSKIGIVNIIDCTFQGKTPALYLGGEEEPKQLVEIAGKPKKHLNKYSTDIEKLTIQNTPINRGHFEYMDIGDLLMQDLKIVDAEFSNSKIVNLVMRNVTMAGKVEFANTIITHRVAEGVNDTSMGTPPSVAN